MRFCSTFVFVLLIYACPPPFHMARFLLLAPRRGSPILPLFYDSLALYDPCLLPFSLESVQAHRLHQSLFSEPCSSSFAHLLPKVLSRRPSPLLPILKTRTPPCSLLRLAFVVPDKILPQKVTVLNCLKLSNPSFWRTFREGTVFLAWTSAFAPFFLSIKVFDFRLALRHRGQRLMFFGSERLGRTFSESLPRPGTILFGGVAAVFFFSRAAPQPRVNSPGPSLFHRPPQMKVFRWAKSF